MIFLSGSRCYSYSLSLIPDPGIYPTSFKKTIGVTLRMCIRSRTQKKQITISFFCFCFFVFMMWNFFLFSEFRNGWLIKTASKSFAVYAATNVEKQQWMAHINKCIDDLLRKSLYNFFVFIYNI